MRNRLSDYQEEYPVKLFNLEATPAESTAYRLAKHDLSAGRISVQPEARRYSVLHQQFPSSGRIQLDILMHWIFRMNCRLFIHLGTVFHAFLGEKLPNWKVTISGTQDCREL